MMILRWSIFLLLIVKIPNVRCLFEKCFSSGRCEESLQIEILQESSEKEKETFNPLYLIGNKSSYKLAIPQETVTDENEQKTIVEVHYIGKQKVIYACPKTLKSSPREKVSPALSQQEDILMSSKSQVIDASCSQRVEPTMRSLNKPCWKSESPEGEFHLYEIGFKVFIRHRSILDFLMKIFKREKSEETEKYTWHTLYVVCTNTKTHSTLYTIHTLYGESVGVGVSNEKFSKKFREISEIESKDGTLLEQTNSSSASMDKIFQQGSVKELFEGLFGKRAARRFFQGAQDFLAKGHLVPDGDMTFIPWKNATYLYTNVTPMWQVLNNGVWKTIENNIRKLAKESRENLTIHTGVYEILSYDETKIFLGAKNTTIMPVPLCLWKVVHNEKRNQAIAFVVINDPHEGGKSLCPPGEDFYLCDANGWLKGTTKKESDKKTIICCYQVEKLRETIPYIPNIRYAEIPVLQNFTNI